MKLEVSQSSMVESLLQRRGKLSEAQLFGAVMSDKIADHTSPEVAKEFRKNFRQAKRYERERAGERGIVNAAMRSLDMLIAGGKISQDCARVLTNESWTLSQLDENPNNVARRSEMGMDVSRSCGVEQYNQKNALYQIGELSLTEVSAEMLSSQRDSSSAHPQTKVAGVRNSTAADTIREVSNSQSVAPQFGSSPIYQRGFLFKPFSDSNGNVVILMPPSLTGKVRNVSIQSREGIESGAYGGVGNGFREHFRFRKPGNGYAPDLSIVVMLHDGTSHKVTIPNPGLRYEVK
jgi:hypothetical protein